MLKKVIIISGIAFSSILLVGCNEEPEVEVIETSENQENDANFLSELHNKIKMSIAEQTDLDSESMGISLGGDIKEMSVSVSFSKDIKIDETMIQQIVEDSIKSFSDTKNITINKENVTLKIEKY